MKRFELFLDACMAAEITFSLEDGELYADYEGDLSVDMEVGIQHWKEEIIALLAGREKQERHWERIPVRERSTPHLPLSFAQQRLWFLDQLEQGSAHYNMPAALRVTGHFDVALAQQAFARIIAR
ncbi:condensation domain-containing protein, partial [Janthinobacterium sp. PSPC1-1]|uniref:condensation domain-containing protein n=1 Tax=Janthinobacterium sp. PSPC1-1 TaxID=2804581 RepID=UPI003CF546AB